MARKRSDSEEPIQIVLEDANDIVPQKHVELPKPPEKPKVPFTTWFDKMMKSGKVRDHQDEALLVFFKKQGLKTLESEENYNEAFKKF
jgi:hypothetical protein